MFRADWQRAGRGSGGQLAVCRHHFAIDGRLSAMVSMAKTSSSSPLSSSSSSYHVRTPLVPRDLSDPWWNERWTSDNRPPADIFPQSSSLAYLLSTPCQEDQFAVPIYDRIRSFLRHPQHLAGLAFHFLDSEADHRAYTILQVVGSFVVARVVSPR